MKNRVGRKGKDRPKKSRSKTVELLLSVRIKRRRVAGFERMARVCGLTLEQLVSVMVEMTALIQAPLKAGAP